MHVAVESCRGNGVIDRRARGDDRGALKERAARGLRHDRVKTDLDGAAMQEKHLLFVARRVT